MKTLIIKYTFNDEINKSAEEQNEIVVEIMETLEKLCGCYDGAENCSFEAGSSRWVTHSEDEYVDDCVAKLDDVED